MGRVRRTKAQVAALCEPVADAWNAGQTMSQIVEALGISVQRGKDLLKSARRRALVTQKRGTGSHPKPDTTKQRNAVVSAFNKGNTQAEIGTMLGITRGTVGRMIAEARAVGIPTVRYSTAETSRRQTVAVRQNRHAIGQTATDN